MAVQSSDIVLILVAILFPPAATGFITGCSGDLCITILLTILGYIPGHLHAFYIIYRRIQSQERYGPHGAVYKGNATWEPIHDVAAPQQQQPPAYGATQ